MNFMKVLCEKFQGPPGLHKIKGYAINQNEIKFGNWVHRGWHAETAVGQASIKGKLLEHFLLL